MQFCREHGIIPVSYTHLYGLKRRVKQADDGMTELRPRNADDGKRQHAGEKQQHTEKVLKPPRL